MPVTSPHVLGVAVTRPGEGRSSQRDRCPGAGSSREGKQTLSERARDKLRDLDRDKEGPALLDVGGGLGHHRLAELPGAPPGLRGSHSHGTHGKTSRRKIWGRSPGGRVEASRTPSPEGEVHCRPGGREGVPALAVGLRPGRSRAPQPSCAGTPPAEGQVCRGERWRRPGGSAAPPGEDGPSPARRGCGHDVRLLETSRSPGTYHECPRVTN